MKKLLAVLVMLAVLATPVLATSWNIESYTDTVDDYFEGDFTTGIIQYGIDTTGTDPWYDFEVTKLSKRATWTDGGGAEGETYYECPGEAGEAAYGEAEVYNWVYSTDDGYFNTNFMSNFAQLSEGGGSYPNGNFGWASYGNELSADGEYEIGSVIREIDGSNNYFAYIMNGDGSGEIRYGSARYSAAPNWADSGSIILNRWEYNGAEATGEGSFEEHLGGEDYLQNYKYTLPGGGTIDTQIYFEDGMDSTPIWMYAN